ncbi:MAG TPA: hypothetical protein DCY79_03690 [Planctomycetaceae bacterium]|nr:hypothetical protein [Blastopirellula sp.]HAY78886.1 hypothetical protein [Planctomycetaceae bacterium]
MSWNVIRVVLPDHLQQNVLLFYLSRHIRSRDSELPILFTQVACHAALRSVEQRNNNSSHSSFAATQVG